MCRQLYRVITMARQAVQTTFAPVAGVKLPRPFQTSVAAEPVNTAQVRSLMH